ncbi:hypothetical protein GF336_07255 [Candidatus Woesearchaeota archaeon]|nr:hypothetical protein [Candidatus Woesearchaeota archaeon]
MKKTTILLSILAVGILLMVSGCGKDEEPEPAPAPEPEPEPEPVEDTQAQPTEEPDVTDEGKIDYGTRGILSDVECDGKTISAIITNVNDDVMTAIPQSHQSDLRIQVKGINMQEFECDKEEIAPGEYAVCSDLIGNEKLKEKMISSEGGDVQVAVWFASDSSNRGVQTVTCSGASTAMDEAMES